MKVFSSLLFFTPSLAFRRAAQAALADLLPADVAENVWVRTLHIRAELKKSRNRRSAGVDLVLRYLEWDCALFKALQEGGVAQEDAGQLIERINWMIFGPVIAMSFKLSRLRSANLRIRVRWILDLMFSVLFTSPFQRRQMMSQDGVAFDVTVCPLAQYCRDQGVPELTRYAACSLDFQMAKTWGVELKRSQTIAEGHRLCDFRFQIPAQQDAAAERPLSSH